MFRIGFGYDVHALVTGRPLIIGGITIPHEKGLAGHSDADVLLHAICDAILGAINSGDLGTHFPDTDPKYKGIDSLYLLDEVLKIMTTRGFEIVNIDSTVVAQRPRLKPYVRAMKDEVAKVTGINPRVLSIKATTTEKLGFTGEEKGISAYAVVLLQQVAEGHEEKKPLTF